MIQKKPSKIKVIFNIVQDEDGYPPVSVESLWVSPIGNGNYIIENIPFFIYGISRGYEISVENKKGVFYFKSICRPSNSSVFRAIIKDKSNIEMISSFFKNLQCLIEYNSFYNLISIEIPEIVDANLILNSLINFENDDYLDFEEGVLNHKINYI